MLINIKEIPEGHSVIDQNVTMTEEQIKDGGFVGEVVCHADIERLQFQIFLRVSYTCEVNLECSRCLNTLKYPVSGMCDIILQEEGAPDSLGTDEVDYNFSDRGVSLDVRQSLYEELMINLPIKPLCKNDCPGVIEYTQRDKDNEKAIDPRWEALKKLKENNQENS